MSNRLRPKKPPSTGPFQKGCGLAFRILRPLLTAEQVGAQVMLAFIGKDRHDDMAFAQSLRYFQRRPAGGTRRYSEQKTFFGSQTSRTGRRFRVADRNDLVENLTVENRWDETGADALDLVITWFAARDHRRCRGLDGADAHAFHLLFQHFADAGDRAACTDAGDESVDALELLEQFDRGGLAMHLRIRRIVELLWHEVVAMLLLQFLGLMNGAAHSFGVWRQDELRAVGS